MVTKFVANKVLHHVCLPFIIESNQQSEYDIDKKYRLVNKLSLV